MKIPPKRLLFIITGLSTGGAEMMLLKLLERISRTHFSPSIISLMAPGSIARHIEALGIPIESMEFNRGILSPLAFCNLVIKIRNIKPDIVHTWMYHADLLGGLAAHFAGVRKIAWCIRNSDLSKEKTRFTTRLIVRLCARLSPFIPQHIISCSEQALRIHAKLGYKAEKMSVIPNGFDLSRFKPDAKARHRLRAEQGIPEDAPLVGLIARFDPQKNHTGFFKAAGLLLKRFPNAHFILAGSGVDRQNKILWESIEQNHLSAHVHLLGLRTDIPEIMAALDVLASASSYGEAFPNVLGEAMASGVPCAVTKTGDSAFIVGDTGKAVEINDMEGLADALTSILSLSSSERIDLGAHTRERVEKYFEIGQIAQQYEDIYTRL